MKISLFALTDLTPGKYNIKDTRLDEVDKVTQSKKKTYVQVELAGEDALFDADAVLALKENRADLILKDLEFVETRLTREPPAAEKSVLEKLKNVLEKEEFCSSAGLSDEEKKIISGYGLVTLKPIILCERGELETRDALLSRALRESGYISYFTTGEKETRAWLIKNGTNAWEASGVIHSDIQRGFIRAEIISLEDFLQAGGESRAKQAGKLRLEQKEYAMKDGDITNFRFNK